MKLPESACHLVARFGLAVGLAFLAGVLLTVSIAGSSQSARPLAAPALAPNVQTFERFNVSTPSPVSPAADVQRAWRRAREIGIYHFATTLVEKRYPAPSLVNVGGGPQEQEVRLEGETDLPAHKLNMRLWQGGGSAANPADAAEILVDGDKAFARGAGGGTWQPVEDFSSNFAPDADLMSYLAGIKNVRAAAAEEQGSGGAGERFLTHHASRITVHV